MKLKAKSLVHAFVASQLDYCNALYLGLPINLLSTLHSVLNAAVCLVAKAPCYSSISDLMLTTLHWLLISDQIEYKRVVLVTSLNLFHHRFLLLHLCCSTDRMDVHVPRSRTNLIQHRSFRVTGPSLWNGLSPSAHVLHLTTTLSSLQRLIN